ncbi:MAG: Abi family protein [Sphingobacteriales bacterium]|nr:MAG: Abi family protein [Sphingobacteriales bacterium]
MRFEKPPQTTAELVKKLQDRGLHIADVARATHFLENISYYRLGGYWYTLQKDFKAHTFQPGATFEQVIEFYNFDRELRLLLFDAIERIEVGVRTRLIYHLSHAHDPWWFEDESLFKNYGQFKGTLDEIYSDMGHTNEDFIGVHRNKYKTPRTPPAWKTLEVVSFGRLSKLYSNLKPSPAKQDIAKSMGLPNNVYLESWLTSVVVLRNYCAHHSRIFNRLFSFPPKTLKTSPRPWIRPSAVWQDNQKLYYQMAYVLYMLDVVSPGNSFRQRWKVLLEKYPSISPLMLGIPPYWKQEPLWQA